MIGWFKYYMIVLAISYMIILALSLIAINKMKKLQEIKIKVEKKDIKF